MCNPQFYEHYTAKSVKHWKLVWISILLVTVFHGLRFIFVGLWPTFLIHRKPGKYDESLAKVQELSNDANAP